LVGLVLVAASVHGLLALRSPSPWIVPDELIYSELAKSLGEGGLPRIRGEVSFDYGLGYPLLLAPIWALFEHVPTAYAVAKVWNALLMSLAAVPAFFLARRFADDGLALLVAGLTVAVPSLLYAGTILTEVALYPAFLLALLAVVAALEQPSATRQILALAAIALACSIKMLAAVLVPAYVLGIAIFLWLETRERAVWLRRLRAYAPTWIALGAIGTLGVVVATALGSTPAAVLGAYAVVLGEIEPLSIPWWALVHLAELDLYAAVIPFAATVLVVSGSVVNRSPRRDRLFTALTVPVVLGVILVAAAFSSDAGPGVAGHAPSSGARERSTFLLAPVLFLGLAIWLSARPWRPRRAVVVAATAGLLPAAIPLERLDENVRFQALALVPWAAVDRVVPWLAIALPLCLLLAFVFIRASGGSVPAVAPVALVLATLVLVGWVAHGPMRWASEWTARQAWGERPDWVDAAVGSSAEVSAVWYEPPGEPFAALAPRHRVLWVAEVFNRSLGHVYEIGSPLPYALPTTGGVRVGEFVATNDGAPLDAGTLVFVPCHVTPLGRTVGADHRTGAAVYRVERPLRLRVRDPVDCEGNTR
jgi:hypothetical protein